MTGLRRVRVFAKAQTIGVGLLVLAGPAMADRPYPEQYRPVFEGCVSDATADQLMQCVGDAASACMESEPDGQTTFGMTACTMIEAGFWDDRLNALWPDVRASVRADDAAEADFADGAFAQRGDALLTAQRAWIAFRDAECALDYALWGAGSIRSIAAASCKLDMTAARVQRLQSILEPM